MNRTVHWLRSSAWPTGMLSGAFIYSAWTAAPGTFENLAALVIPAVPDPSAWFDRFLSALGVSISFAVSLIVGGVASLLALVVAAPHERRAAGIRLMLWAALWFSGFVAEDQHVVSLGHVVTQASGLLLAIASALALGSDTWSRRRSHRAQQRELHLGAAGA